MEIIGTAIHVINILLILGLLCIFIQNYRKMKSKYTVGLMIFAVLFLIQSFMGVYFDISMVMYSSKSAETAGMVLEFVKTVAFAIMLWISWE